MNRTLLGRLRAQWRALDAEIAALDQQILGLARTHPLARRLMTIPGIGALIATALIAAQPAPGPAKPDPWAGQVFRRGRDLACWLGLVPGSSPDPTRCRPSQREASTRDPIARSVCAIRALWPKLVPGCRASEGAIDVGARERPGRASGGHPLRG